MILAILQARMGSTRLPGKAMLPILGESMIRHQIRRIRKAELIDELIIAAPDTRADDVLGDCGCWLFQGAEHDVLKRFVDTVDYIEKNDNVRVSHVVRLTADCPLIDPEIIDRCIEMHLSSCVAYTANTWHYPDGLDCEVIDVRALREANQLSLSVPDREHVTPMVKHCGPVQQLPGPRLRPLRWTVDTQADYEFVKRVYEALYPKNPNFRMKDILAWQESQISQAV